MPMFDLAPFIAGGIPLTKADLKYGNIVDQNGNIILKSKDDLALDYGSCLAIMREQNRIETIERYMWTAMPPGLTADIIERILYYRGKGVLYFNDEVGKFQFLPFALEGLIDEYGRYLEVNSLPFIGVDENDKHQRFVKQGIKVVYDLPYNMDMLKMAQDGEPVGIIINDSSLALGQQPVIRSKYVTPLLCMLARVIQLINSAMYGCADHSLVTLGNEGELDSFYQAIDAIDNNILNGRRYTAILNKFPIEQIKTSTTVDIEGLFNVYNSLTNMLKSITGVANPGVFDKKAHLLQEEQDLNGSNADDIYYNGLRSRQEACLLIQAYYNTPIWCTSKRALSEDQKQDLALGNTDEPDNTTATQPQGGNQNAQN